jgi:hypothetical protein
MMIRIAAGCVAVAAVALTLAPLDTSARGGGFGGGAISFHGGAVRGAAHGSFHARAARPLAAPVAPLAGAASGAHAAAANARVNSAARFRGRRFLGGGWPDSVWGDEPWYGGGSDYYGGGYYDPYATAPDGGYYQGGYPPPAYAADVPPGGVILRERVIYVPYRPACSTQTYKVPSEAGGRRSINVVRC